MIRYRLDKVTRYRTAVRIFLQENHDETGLQVTKVYTLQEGSTRKLHAELGRLLAELDAQRGGKNGGVQPDA